MDLLLILTYGALCYAAFKVFKIPVNKWTLPTAVLGGVFMIGFILLFMNYNHPYSRIGRIYFVTTPIVPEVQGRVIEVPVKANTPLKQGEVLFKMIPPSIRPPLHSGAPHSRKRSSMCPSSQPRWRLLKAKCTRSLPNAIVFRSSSSAASRPISLL